MVEGIVVGSEKDFVFLVEVAQVVLFAVVVYFVVFVFLDFFLYFDFCPSFDFYLSPVLNSLVAAEFFDLNQNLC